MRVGPAEFCLLRCRGRIVAGALACCAWAPLAGAQTIRTESVLPATTDPAITMALSAHRVAFATDIAHRNRLFVYLHGAGGTASSGTLLLSAAAENGFHAIGITYPMDQTPFQFCSTDFHCQELFRRELIEGVDSSPHIAISRADSIENRIIKLLQHLDTAHPGEGWGSYAPGASIAWTSMVVYGHSMGGANAALLARDHELAGACISAPAADIQGWWSAPATPVQRIFGFSHVQDRFAQLQGVWATMGLNAFGAVQDVATVAAPYSNTHMLSTSVAPAAGNDYHNSPTTDGATPRLGDGTPVYQPVWSYMMLGGAAQTPACPGDADGDGAVGLSDIAIVVQHWGDHVAPGSGADQDGSGTVGLGDAAVVIGAWGVKCP
ncbi:MAG TPA: hypothetical protein VG797_04715 [Phycisphaerales bacterium]|nr:hypothetical protein [Phycisphaerales bacterium]